MLCGIELLKPLYRQEQHNKNARSEGSKVPSRTTEELVSPVLVLNAWKEVLAKKEFNFPDELEVRFQLVIEESLGSDPLSNLDEIDNALDFIVKSKWFRQFEKNSTQVLPEEIKSLEQEIEQLKSKLGAPQQEASKMRNILYGAASTSYLVSLCLLLYGHSR